MIHHCRYTKKALLCIAAAVLFCSPPTMKVIPEDFHVKQERATLGILLSPSQPFFGKPTIVNKTFGPGYPIPLFTNFFQIHFRNAILRNTLFSNVIFLDDSLVMKSKAFPYKKNYLEMKVPSQGLNDFSSRGIDYLLILQNFAIDTYGKYVSRSSPPVDKYAAGQPIINHLDPPVYEETGTGIRLKFSGKALIVNCSNDSIIAFGNVIVDNSAIGLSADDWIANIKDFAEELFDNGPFCSSKELTVREK